MKIYHALQIGSTHALHCEDHFIQEKISSTQILIAVLDGCTMGKESVFASLFYGKILRKIAKGQYYEQFATKKSVSNEIILREVLRELAKEIRAVSSRLFLEINELLATVILGIVEIEDYSAELITIGDGLVIADGVSFEFEQNDRPDYLAYHLNENFDSFYAKQDQRISLSYFSDLSIMTDGIYSFHTAGSLPKDDSTDLIHYLTQDRNGMEYDLFLENKLMDLRETKGIIPADDLAIIRLIRC